MSKAAGPELRSLESDSARLAQIAGAGGGRVYDLDDPAQGGAVWDRSDVETVESAQPLWPLLLLWALGVYMADIATRRVAWDRLLSREAATARHLTRRPSGSAAGAWKESRAKRRSATTEQHAAPTPEKPSREDELSARRRRVEEAIRQTGPESAPERLVEGDADQTDARSGLLAAKKRASQRFDEHDET